MNLIDIEKSFPGGKNMGGLGRNLWMVDIDDVLTFPTLPDDDVATINDVNVYQTAMVLKSGKSLSRVEITQNTGGLSMADQGEVDGISQKPVLTFFHAGNSDQLRGFIQWSNNRDVIIVVQDAEGRYFLMGNEQFPANKVASDGLATGETTQSRKGAKFQFEMAGFFGPVPRIPEALIPFAETSGSGSGS